MFPSLRHEYFWVCTCWRELVWATCHKHLRGVTDRFLQAIWCSMLKQSTRRVPSFGSRHVKSAKDELIPVDKTLLCCGGCSEGGGSILVLEGDHYLRCRSARLERCRFQKLGQSIVPCGPILPSASSICVNCARRSEVISGASSLIAIRRDMRLLVRPLFAGCVTFDGDDGDNDVFAGCATCGCDGGDVAMFAECVARRGRRRLKNQPPGYRSDGVSSNNTRRHKGQELLPSICVTIHLWIQSL